MEEEIGVKHFFSQQDITVIIPTYNEDCYIGNLLQQLQANSLENIIVVDAESTDDTAVIVRQFGAQLKISAIKNRASQLNFGARHAITDYLLFLHADVRLPQNFKEKLLFHINSKGFGFGNFQLNFDSNHWFLKFNQSFSYFKFGAFQFGDQGLLVRKEFFEEVRGYNENHLFMEGNHIIRKLRAAHQFTKMKSTLTVSARKYEKVGVLKLQFSYYTIYVLERIGLSQITIKKWFIRVLKT